MTRDYPLHLAGETIAPNAGGAGSLDVLDKYDGSLFARCALAGPDLIERAIAACVEAAPAMRATTAFERQAALRHCADRFRERAEELAQVVRAEAGKPIRDARGEVARLIDTFRLTADECGQPSGEVMRLDASERAAAYAGMWKRVPIGPCSFITPFNFPLNLVAHKVAPAIAAGCPFVLKPSELTPISALLIGEVLAETKLPKGVFSILPCDVAHAAPLVEDDRFKFLSFTGSQRVGWALKARAGKKKVALELGGNAACVIDADADLDDAVARLVFGAFYQSGQSCVGVQRVIVHERVYDALREKFVAAAKALKVGDPRDPETFIGPMISEKEAKRAKGWIDEAVAAGATLLCGGERRGALLDATILENVAADQKISCEEAFGPVAVLSRFADFDDALRQVNASAYGLQAGVFTSDIQKAWRAWDALEVGAVVINDIPSWRVDHMPYGGVKESGLGREGARFAIEEMTEIRLFALRRK